MIFRITIRPEDYSSEGCKDTKSLKGIGNYHLIMILKSFMKISDFPELISFIDSRNNEILSFSI